jgi:hypothetical protein
MSKYNISCFAIEGTRRMWEVGPDGFVWPCCYFGNAWDKRLMMHADELDDPIAKQLASNKLNDESALLFDDPVMLQLMKEDPNWNNLEYHSLEEIINHKIYQTYIHPTGWESDNPPLVCVDNCNKCKT